MERIKKELSALAAVFLLPVTVCAQTLASADFSVWEEFPLVKKIGVYQTPWTCKEWLVRDFPKMSQLEARSLRYEFGWGENVYGGDAISGSAANVRCDFSAADLMFDMAAENTYAFVFSHGYTPFCLQPGERKWREKPNSMNAWKTANNKAASHWREKGYANRYIEVWNEPDLDVFFDGTLDDYLEIYKYAAIGARDGDQDAKIGGPANAFATAWHQSLVDYVLSEKKRGTDIPLDFLSAHVYSQYLDWQMDPMRKALVNMDNKYAEVLLTEYSPYAAEDWTPGGKIEQAEAAMTLFNSLPTILKYTDLTHVTWAQYIDARNPNTGTKWPNSTLGMVNCDDGSRKSVFNALKLYGMMPVHRCSMSAGGLQGMASADDTHAAAVLWNTGKSDKKVWFTLKNIPFGKGTVKVYHVDTGHNSWLETGNDELTPTSVAEVEFSGNSYKVKDTVKGQGVLFVMVCAEDAGPLFPVNNFAKLITTKHWYPKRDDTAPYALFDPKTWTAYLSMNSDGAGSAIECVTAEDVPSVMTVRARLSDGMAAKGQNSSLNIRIDYQSAGGAYTTSVLFHGGAYNKSRTVSPPWGTMKQPDEIVEVSDFSSFDADIASHRPADFSGRVIITFEMTDMGKGAKAEIQLLNTGASHIGEAASGLDNGKISNDVYNLQGQKVNRDYRGIVIVNGKKRLI